MIFKNTPARYGAITKAFHWTIALLIIGMLVLGLTMGSYPALLRLKAVLLHKSIGITILTLAALRVSWHVYSKRPHFAAGVLPWEKKAAHGMHVFLYLCLFCMPLAGWLFSSAAGRTVAFFGLFDLPNLVQKDQHLKALFATTHMVLGYTIIIAVCAHAAAALKHHFISKDETLRRMLPLVQRKG